MGLVENIAYVNKLLDNYAAARYPWMGVASQNPKDFGVPPEMWDGEVNSDGWVAWKMLPSTLKEADIEHLEEEFGVRFPPLFRAYMLARFQLFDQVHSQKYDQLIFMTAVPSRCPLKPLRTLLQSWGALNSAGFNPFAEWGDAWGPMCFDAQERDSEGDCPIVWMDHELLCPLGGERCKQREVVLPLVRPLYLSFQEFLEDVFSVAG